ncbi:hypothetical protein GRI43_03325 [Altererythrobacter luteolus]|uniref:Uncharacterized protein n=1 Tax=Pontixanthobacter luteolus TaxID=295089 RepID=A0A6I4UY61_9SPHN|nr:hypothetical protein [Pontixanthobacter luteolus]MXP46425.1 hypothetical protein [Pontixanthobacter luteolus]
MSAGSIELGGVPLGLLRRYLKVRAWDDKHAAKPSKDLEGSRLSETMLRLLKARRTEVDSQDETFTVFTSKDPALNNIELVVPTARDTKEYELLVGRVVHALAAVEGRNPKDVIRSIRQIGFDVVRSRIPDTYVVNDTIVLERAESFIKGFRNVLAATASTELDPKPYYERSLKAGGHYANNCRFGHTFRGSFGFTIESPLSPHDQTGMPDVEPQQPFERRVIERLAVGLKTLEEAVIADNIDPIVEGYKSGLSANMCDHLSALVESTSHAEMVFDFSLSPEWKSSIVAAEQKKIVIGPAHLEASKAAAKKLRRPPEPIDADVRGRVVSLSSTGDPSNVQDKFGDREVALHWASEKHGDITVRTSLSPKDYLRALDAHGSGRPIRLKGKLEHSGRKWELKDPFMVG